MNSIFGWKIYNQIEPSFMSCFCGKKQHATNILWQLMWCSYILWQRWIFPRWLLLITKYFIFCTRYWIIFRQCNEGMVFAPELQMIFCYQNCSDLLWEKNAQVINKNFWNSRPSASNFQTFWDHLNNLFQQWKVRTISGNRMLF